MALPVGAMSSSAWTCELLASVTYQRSWSFRPVHMGEFTREAHVHEDEDMAPRPASPRPAPFALLFNSPGYAADTSYAGSSTAGGMDWHTCLPSHRRAASA
jgi:hypothetical protein